MEDMQKNSKKGIFPKKKSSKKMVKYLLILRILILRKQKQQIQNVMKK
jgi:hypothetical protein